MNSRHFSLEGKVVCLVGGTGLIGNAICDGLRKMGATVSVGCRHPELGTEMQNRLFHEKIDLSDENSIRDFFRNVVSKNNKIDVLINCSWPKYEYNNLSVGEIDSNAMLEDINTHLIGYFNCTRYCFMEMKKAQKGSIINLGSIYGERVPDFRIYEDTEINNVPTYSIIKSGIHMMSKYFAVLAAKYNIRVNNISPGGVYNNHSSLFVKQYSDKVPMNRMAVPEDIVEPVLFLASDGSSYVTGQTLFVDGGFTVY